MTGPKAPSNLSARAVRFWDSVCDKYELGEHELLTLEQVCRTMDDIRSLENRLRRDLAHDGVGLITRGVAKQPVINPIVPELRQMRQGLRQLIAALKLPDDDAGAADGEDLATSRSRGARAAAQARWGARGTGS